MSVARAKLWRHSLLRDSPILPDRRKRRQQLGDLKAPDDSGKVRLIEEGFHRLIFGMEAV
ncbi:MAG: hypothetical protein A2Y95_05005 [Deltaproteobacteria bacterium RBG_13_65_10]|nr:MAG: hypothetical protein A2Y95_05005 [Deltaproteobacteria bacterium RBG_13_65_10]